MSFFFENSVFAVILFQILIFCSEIESRGNKYQVIIVNDAGFCSGVLLHPSWVFLSSDCLTQRPGKLSWQLVKTLSKPRQYREVEKTLICPEDNCYIAALKVNSPFAIEPAAIFTKNKDIPCDPGNYVSVVRDENYRVMESNFSVVRCPKYYKDSCVCGRRNPSDEEKERVCPVKRIFSDGYLMCGDRVVGFLIWESCEFKGTTSVFVNVGKFLDFVGKKKGGRKSEEVVVKAQMKSKGSLNGGHVYKILVGAVLVVLFF